ncbi:MAG: NAD(+)/NADH kinase [Bacillota bacterium]|nr:NAD(+)/NADH kinase [Bacillota bacterium]
MRAGVVGIRFNRDKPEATGLVKELQAFLEDKGYHWSLDPDPEQVEVALVLVVGGDGTILQAARRYAPKGVPLLGINLGHVGFLTELEAAECLESLSAYLEGPVVEDRRLMLWAGQGEKGGLALNDVVVTRAPYTRLLTFTVSQEGQEIMKFRADGLVVATPTGSTAYSRAAGGPVVHPAVPALILTPLASYSFHVRPTVIPAEGTVEVRVEEKARDVRFTLDGQIPYGLEVGEPLRIRKSPVEACFWRSPAWSFYRRLREKGRWDGGEG